MSEKEEIQAWLNSARDFDKGLMLYIAYFDDIDTKFTLQRHRSAERLFTILRERFYELKDLEGTTAPVSNSPVINVNHKQLTGDFNPPEELLTRWGELKTEQERWHTEMSMIGEGVSLSETQTTQRGQLAKMVVQHEDKLQELGSAINYFRQHGMLPVGFKLNVRSPRAKKTKAISKLTDTEKVLKLKNSIAPNISKLRKKIADKKLLLASLDEKDCAKANKKLTEWETELKELEAQKKLIVG